MLMVVEKGDVVIRRERHSCDVRFVEAVDDTGILLVNGVQDRFYTPVEFDLFEKEYELLVRKEDRLDTFIEGWNT